MTEDEQDIEEEITTESIKKRFSFTNDILATLIVIGFIGLVAAGGIGIINFAVLPEIMMYGLVGGFISVIIWAFGPTFFEAVGEIR